MKSSNACLIVTFLVVAASASGAAAGNDPAMYVNPFIGTSRVNNGHTFPGATCPGALVQPSPDTGTDDWQHCSGYTHEDAYVYGFSQTHLSGTGCADLGDVLLQPFTGRDAELADDFRGAKDFASETASPGYYAVSLTNFGVKVELTATERVGYHRWTFPEGRDAHVLVDLQYGNVHDSKNDVSTHVKESKSSLGQDGRTLTGHNDVQAWLARSFAYRLEFSQPWKSYRVLPKKAGEKADRYVFDFTRPADGVVVAKVAMSTTDEDGAARNFAAEAKGGFDETRAAARAKWNGLLSRCELPGADDVQKTIFYSALYHLYIAPNVMSDVDGRYRGADRKVHTAGAGVCYTGFSLWDTFRAAHPLYTITAPERVPAYVGSFLEQYKAVGFLPVIPYFGCESYCMIGNHSVPVLVDAYLKGIRGFDVDLAFEAVTNSLTVTHPGKPCEDWGLLDRYGYYPLDFVKRQSVSRTLECSYDDACAARFAEALGRRDSAAFFAKRSASWRNVFDRSCGFARGRDSRGRWRDPFNPYAFGRIVPDYTEGNGWQYSWHVLHDVPGLVEAMGGAESFTAKLDSLFLQPGKEMIGPGAVAKAMTGFLGQYSHGNEPSHHIAWLYPFAGHPEKTQEKVRKIAETLYKATDDGICGNDDCGQISSWYVFACLGFYPVDPCGRGYVVGAPQAAKTVLHLDGGKTFTVVAENFSKANKYVECIRLNGSPLHGFILDHADIMAGGELVFTMSPEPPVASSLGLLPVEMEPVARHEPLRLAEGGRLNFAIVGPFKAERDFRGPEGQSLKQFGRDSLKRAADTLVWAFNGCFGAKPEVLEEDDPKASSYRYVVALGKTRLAAELGVVPDRLPREGFEIKTCEKGVVIAGMDGFAIPGFYDVFNWRSHRINCNGTEWGAADFVERFLGCRKFSLLNGDDYMVTPRRSTLIMSPAHYSDHPRQHFRAGRTTEGWRVGTSTDFFGGEAPSPFDLAKAHPDMIEDIFYRDATGRLWQNPEVYGKNFLDVTNPKLAEILVGDFEKYYAQNGRGTYWKDAWCPSTRYMWFGQCDRRVKFSDDVLEKYRREDPRPDCDRYSELYGHFYLYLAKLAKERFPDRRLVLMAYSNYLRAPRTTGRFPDNVQIMACIGTPALAASDVYMNDVYECYDEWNALTSHKVVPYLYNLCYGANGGPVPMLMQGLFMGEFLKKIAPHTDELGIYYPCFGRFAKADPLAAYLMFRSAWNPDFDALAGARDYATGLLGVEAGAKLADFVARLRALWVERYIPEVDNGPYVRRHTRCIPQLQHEAIYVKMLSPDVLDELESRLAAVEKLVAGDAKRAKIFAQFAGPMRKTFADARAYQSIKVADVDVGCSPTRLPDFKKAYVDDGSKVVNPDAKMSWSDEGLSLSVVSPAPYKLGKDIWDSDSFELFIAPGDDKPVNLYQFAVAANGKYEDFHSQIDPPRPNDMDWKAAGLKVDVKRGEKEWRLDLFLPWSALYDAAPKPGDVWRMNLISNRTSPQEYSSIAPTLNNNFRWNFYTRIHFKD